MRYLLPRALDLKPGIAWAFMALIASLSAAQDSAPINPPEGSSRHGMEEARGASTPLLRGQAALDGGRMEEAVLEFRQALEGQPESAETRIGLARALALQRRDSEAMAHYQRAAEIDPTNVLPRVGMGDILLAQGKLDEALVHLRAAIELDPTAERARLAEAQVLNAQGRFKEVLERLEEAHEILPASGLAAYGLAWMLAASPDASIRDGERALDLAQAVFESHQSLPNAELVAEALAELDRCDNAAEWLREIGDEVVPSGAPPEIADRLQRNLDRFDQGPPCRSAVEPPVGSDG